MKLNTQLVLLAMVASSSLAAPVPAGFSLSRPKKPSTSVSAKPDAPAGASGSGSGSNAAAPKTDKDGKDGKEPKLDKDGKPKEPFSKVKFYDDHGTKFNGGIATVAGGVAIAAAVTNHEADAIQRLTDAKNDETDAKNEAKANGGNGGSNGNGSTPATRRAGSFRVPSRPNSAAGKPPSRQNSVEPHNVPLPPPTGNSRQSSIDNASQSGSEKGKAKEEGTSAKDEEPKAPSGSNGNTGGGSPHSSFLGKQPDDGKKPDDGKRPDSPSGAQAKADEDKKVEDRKKSVNSAQNAAAGTVGGIVGLAGGAVFLDNAIKKKEDNEAKAAKADADAAKANAQRRSPEPLSVPQIGMTLLGAGGGGMGFTKEKNSVTQQGFAQGSRHTGAKSRRSPDADLLQARLFSSSNVDNSQTTQAMQQGDSHTGASSGSGGSLFDGGNGSARPPSSGRKHGGGGGSGSASSSKYNRRDAPAQDGHRSGPKILWHPLIVANNGPAKAMNRREVAQLLFA